MPIELLVHVGNALGYQPDVAAHIFELNVNLVVELLNLDVELTDFALELSPSLTNLTFELLEALTSLYARLIDPACQILFELLEALTSLRSRLIDPACQILQAVFDQGTEISFFHGPILPRRYDRGEVSSLFRNECLSKVPWRAGFSTGWRLRVQFTK